LLNTCFLKSDAKVRFFLLSQNIPFIILQKKMKTKKLKTNSIN
jgi:hypothetical protein